MSSIHARKQALHYLEVLKVCYPDDLNKQVRVFREYYRRNQERLGLNFNPIILKNVYDSLDSGFLLSRIRSILKNPKGLLRVQGLWNRESRRKFQVIRDDTPRK